MGGKPTCATKVTGSRARAPALPAGLTLVFVAECEHPCWDPKDGELCLGRMKPEETLVEVRRGSDVQIDRQTWV
jgi:hypothetical protein